MNFFLLIFFSYIQEEQPKDYDNELSITKSVKADKESQSILLNSSNNYRMDYNFDKKMNLNSSNYQLHPHSSLTNNNINHNYHSYYTENDNLTRLDGKKHLLY